MGRKIPSGPVEVADEQPDRIDQLRRRAMAHAVISGHPAAIEKHGALVRAAWKRDGSARLSVAEVEAILDEFGLMADYLDRLAGPELNGPRTVR